MLYLQQSTVSKVSLDSWSWLIGVETDVAVCSYSPSASEFDMFWDAFLRTMIVKSSYLRYCDLPVCSKQL